MQPQDTTDQAVAVRDAARTQLVEILDSGHAPDEIDLDQDLRDYGLTSLHKVLFLTTLCTDVQVDLSSFTEEDLAAMRTLRDVVAAVLPHVGKAA